MITRRIRRVTLILLMMLATASTRMTQLTDGTAAASDVRPSVAAPLLTRLPTAPAAQYLGPGNGAWRDLKVAVSDLGANGVRDVLVFTPPVSDPGGLPVLYLLHGLPGNPSDLCSRAASDGLMSAFRAGVQPFMVVCPDGNPTSVADSEWADSVDGGTRLETFLTTEVIEAVEGSQVRDRGMRAIGGFSMGGFGAAAIALRHPQLYGQVAAFAGYFHLDDPSKVFGTTRAEQAAHDPTALVDSSSQLRWYIAQASQDDDPLTAHDSERYARLLSAHGATVQFGIVPGPHAAAWVIAQLPAVAKFLGTGWSTG
jgi:S-formylglutathione hydrolase FrmB